MCYCIMTNESIGPGVNSKKIYLYTQILLYICHKNKRIIYTVFTLLEAPALIEAHTHTFLVCDFLLLFLY